MKKLADKSFAEPDFNQFSSANFARMLGIAIAGYVNVFEPGRLAIGGGLSRASHLFLDRAIQEAAARALPALWRRTRIALAEGGADAGRDRRRRARRPGGKRRFRALRDTATLALR